MKTVLILICVAIAAMLAATVGIVMKRTCLKREHDHDQQLRREAELMQNTGQPVLYLKAG